MAFDYKKEYREFYQPGKKPELITVPKMNYIAVRGKGDPNREDGDYKSALSLLYGIAFTIKMSKRGAHQIEGYFDYVVPPLEGFWHQEGIDGIDYSRKEDFQWIWAALSGFDKAIPLSEVLKYELPTAVDYSGHWHLPLSIQHPLAEIEIYPWDSSGTMIFSRDKSIFDDFLSFFPFSKRMEDELTNE